MKLYLIDGTYELFRNHFGGGPSRTTPGGMDVSATHGIIASTLSLLSESEITHVAASFDSVVTSFRNDVFDDYKTGEGIEQVLLDQFPLAERAMRAIGVTVWSMYDYEADDGLATGARRWVDDVEQVVIMSPDKDMAQLYGDPRIVGYDRRKGAFIDRDAVVDKFGVEPASIPDWLALVGDAADGLPGLPGWGAKSSATILSRYRHLEAIPLDVSLWDVKVRGAEKLAVTLRERIGDALLYRYLAQLRTDVPLPDSLSDLEWKGVPRERFEAFCDEMGFGRLKGRPTRWVE
ncbi:MAG: 5'-3' exonuclease H3TH domain-containing protein [Actinomycetota bacterium]